MEWFVVIVFTIFISGLVLVSIEAIRHANKPKRLTRQRRLRLLHRRVPTHHPMPLS